MDFSLDFDIKNVSNVSFNECLLVRAHLIYQNYQIWFQSSIPL